MSLLVIIIIIIIISFIGFGNGKHMSIMGFVMLSVFRLVVKRSCSGVLPSCVVFSGSIDRLADICRPLESLRRICANNAALPAAEASQN